MNELSDTATDVDYEDDDDNTIEVAMTAENTDNVGDVSVEINVEELLSQIEQECSDAEARASARRKLDEIMEQKRAQKALDDFDDFDIAEGS